MANRIGASDSLGKGTVKRFQSHTFTGDEEGDEYSGSSFGGFGDYFRVKMILFPLEKTARGNTYYLLGIIERLMISSVFK